MPFSLFSMFVGLFGLTGCTIWLMDAISKVDARAARNAAIGIMISCVMILLGCVLLMN